MGNGKAALCTNAWVQFPVFHQDGLRFLGVSRLSICARLELALAFALAMVRGTTALRSETWALLAGAHPEHRLCCLGT
jgi:hypothetical protein